MKKKIATKPKDKKDWENFTQNLNNIYDKDEDTQNNKNNSKSTCTLDLHGLSLYKANEVTKNFIIKCYKNNHKELKIITGKGLRSKASKDPYISSELGILKNSIPDFILSDSELNTIVKSISQAGTKDGGEGAIKVYLNKL